MRLREISAVHTYDPRSFPDVNIGSDHDFMLTTIELKLKTKCFTKCPRIRFEKLNDLKTTEVFQAKVGEKFAALCNVGTL